MLAAYGFQLYIMAAGAETLRRHWHAALSFVGAIKANEVGEVPNKKVEINK